LIDRAGGNEIIVLEALKQRGVILFFSFQAIANESGINFISVKGPELLNMVRAKKKNKQKQKQKQSDSPPKTLRNYFVFAVFLRLLLFVTGSRNSCDSFKCGQSQQT